MVEIGQVLRQTMLENHCSSMCAFLMLNGGSDGICVHESESRNETDGRLCDKGNQPDNRTGLGDNVSRPRLRRLFNA